MEVEGGGEGGVEVEGVEEWRGQWVGEGRVEWSGRDRAYIENGFGARARSIKSFFFRYYVNPQIYSKYSLRVNPESSQFGV